VLEKHEIIDLALRHMDAKDIVDFPEPGDIFTVFATKLVNGEPDPEKTGFQYYGIVDYYTPDEEHKPVGKWVYMVFTRLAPWGEVEYDAEIGLQPHHIAQGNFQTPDREWMVTIKKVVKPAAAVDNDQSVDTGGGTGNCQFLEFPR